jgi:hypothetical protein
MKVLEKGHISDAALENYSLDHLAEPELEVVEEHILICPTCQDRLSEVDDFVRAFRLAHSHLEEAGPGGTSVVGDGWLAETDSTVYAPSPAWFQKPAVWASLAFAAGLVVMIPFLTRPSAQQQATAVTHVALVAQRGATGLAEVPAGRLALQLDLRGVNEDPLLIEVATWDGRKLWSRSVGLADAIDSVSPDMRFNPGQYWIRVRGEHNTALLREFGLKVVR